MTKSSGSNTRALLMALLVMVIGGGWIWISLSPGISPLGSEDLDGDGVNDFFQSVDPVVEYRPDQEGGWTEEKVGYTSSLDLPLLVFYSMLFLIAAPAGVYFTVHMRPVREKQRREARENGVMYDAVRRMASFLEVTPSLLYSVKYSFQSMPPSDRRVLSPLVWGSRGQGRSFGETYREFRKRWSEADPLIGKALSDLRQAGSEGSHPEVKRSARRTIRELTSEARRKASEYSESLKGPSTALFAVGVLLPVLLATMIPVAGLGEGTAWMLAVILWVLLPGAIMIIGGRLVRRRPLFGVEPPESFRPGFSPTGTFLASVGGLSMILVCLFRGLYTDFSSLPVSGEELLYLGVILSVSVIGAGFALFMDGGAGNRASIRKIIMDEVPDLLLELGSRVQEGLSFEGSLSRAVAASGDSIRSIGGSISPPPGMDPENPPPSWIDHLIGTSHHFARAGPEAGGNAIKALGGHIRELNTLKKEMSVKIKSAVGQMEVTASLIAPLMIGGSVAIFHLLESTPVPEGGSVLMVGSPASETISSTAFILLTGGYLLLLSVTTTLVLYRLRSGSERGGWHLVPTRVVAAAFSFCTGAVLGSMIIG